jgi:hypothetical protein
VWLETASETFSARFDERDAPDAELVLRTLETARPRLERTLGASVGPIDVVLHGTEAQLDAAAPLLPLLRRLSAPAARRYVVGWAGEHELHVLSPRALAKRASNVEGSLEMLMLAPTALLARRVVTETNPALHAKLGPRMLARYTRWAWVLEGAAQYFSGQVEHARPAIARRLREGPQPDFPPGRADAILLGGSMFDLLCREEGEAAGVALARGDDGDSPRKALERAFHGRPLRFTEATWRTHLQRMAEGRLPPRRSMR